MKITLYRIKMIKHSVYLLLMLPRKLVKHQAMKKYGGNGGIAPRILRFDIRWRRVVSFKFPPP